MLALSNEFCSNHRMNISWIIEWILLALLHKCKRESNAYQGEFIEFCYNFIECISKMKYIWILLSICGNNQTHISDIEYWHISATIAGSPLAVYFKDSLGCISIAKWDHCGIEATWLEVSVKPQRLLVSCIYHPPDFEDFYDKYLPILVRISVNRKKVIITGDFNSNMQDNSWNGKKFRNILKRVHLKTIYFCVLNNVIRLNKININNRKVLQRAEQNQ